MYSSFELPITFPRKRVPLFVTLSSTAGGTPSLDGFKVRRVVSGSHFVAFRSTFGTQSAPTIGLVPALSPKIHATFALLISFIVSVMRELKVY